MQLNDIASRLVGDTLRVWRRRALAGAVILVFAVAAFVEAGAAARLALEDAIGPVAARLVLTAVFVAVVAVAALFLLLAERREEAQAAQEAAAEKAKPFGGDAQVAAIAEAIHLGYSIARGLRRRPAKDDGAAEADAPDAPPPEDEPEDEAADPRSAGRAL